MQARLFLSFYVGNSSIQRNKQVWSEEIMLVLINKGNANIFRFLLLNSSSGVGFNASNQFTITTSN